MSHEYPISTFQCAMCGNCCRGEGYVRLTPREVGAIASFLDLETEEFLGQYCRTPEIEEHAAQGDVWLIDKPGPDLECIFLENNRCRVNPVKPEQCLGFPLKWRTPDILDYCVGMQK